MAQESPKKRPPSSMTGTVLCVPTGEMMILSGHRSQIADLPEQPLQHFGAPAHVRGNELPDLLGEIEQDRTRLEDRDRTITRCRFMIDQRRDPVVR